MRVIRSYWLFALISALIPLLNTELVYALNEGALENGCKSLAAQLKELTQAASLKADDIRSKAPGEFPQLLESIRKQELEILNKNIVETKSSVDDLEKQVSTLKLQKTKLEKSSAEQLAALTSLIVEKERLKSNLSWFERTLKLSFRKNARQDLANLPALETKIREIGEQLAHLNQDIAKSEKNIPGVMNKSQKKAAELQALEASLQDLDAIAQRKALEAHQKKLHQADDLEGEASAKSKQLALNWAKANIRARDLYQQLRANLNDIACTVDSCQKKASEALSKIKDAQRQAQNTQLSGATEALFGLDGRKNFMDDLASVTNQWDHQKTKEKARAAQRTMEELKSKLNNLKNQVTQLKKRRASLPALKLAETSQLDRASIELLSADLLDFTMDILNLHSGGSDQLFYLSSTLNLNSLEISLRDATSSVNRINRQLAGFQKEINHSLSTLNGKEKEEVQKLFDKIMEHYETLKAGRLIP